MASAAPISSARILARAPRALRPLASQVASRILAPLGGGAVYTDDRAPVEWLTDLSIVQYATGKH
jgi:hypothetical protein